MPIEYLVNTPILAEQLASLFDKSGIRRPTGDLDRLQKMIDNANLTVTAWDAAHLVGRGSTIAGSAGDRGGGRQHLVNAVGDPGLQGLEVGERQAGEVAADIAYALDHFRTLATAIASTG